MEYDPFCKLELTFMQARDEAVGISQHTLNTRVVKHVVFNMFRCGLECWDDEAILTTTELLAHYV